MSTHFQNAFSGEVSFINDMLFKEGSSKCKERKACLFRSIPTFYFLKLIWLQKINKTNNKQRIRIIIAKIIEWNSTNYLNSTESLDLDYQEQAITISSQLASFCVLVPTCSAQLRYIVFPSSGHISIIKYFHIKFTRDIKRTAI